HRLPGAVADLIADRAAHDRAEHRSGHALRVPGRRLVADDFVATDLPRRLDGRHDRLDRNDLRRVLLLDSLIAGEGASGCYGGTTDHEPQQYRFVHADFLVDAGCGVYATIGTGSTIGSRGRSRQTGCPLTNCRTWTTKPPQA